MIDKHRTKIQVVGSLCWTPLRARSDAPVTYGDVPGGVWLHRVSLRARQLSLSQLGGVSYPQELSQLGDM